MEKFLPHRMSWSFFMKTLLLFFAIMCIPAISEGQTAVDTFDGNYCPQRGTAGDEYDLNNPLVFSDTVDLKASSTCEIEQIWAKLDTANNNVRLAFKIGNSGAAIFRLYVQADTEEKGADYDDFGSGVLLNGIDFAFQINSKSGDVKFLKAKDTLINAVDTTILDTVSNPGYFDALNGNSNSCELSGDGQFIEFNIDISVFDLCETNSPGVINIANYAAVSGGSESSNTCNTSEISFIVPLTGEIDDHYICQGDSVDLSILNANGIVVGWEISYNDSTWNPIANSASTTLNSKALYDTVYYRAQIVNDNICAGSYYSGVGTVYVWSSPESYITGESTVCPGSTVIYTGPEGLAQYNWSFTENNSNAQIISTTNNTVTIMAGTCNEDFILQLSATSNDNCVSSTTIHVDVVDLTPPSITTNAQNQTVECDGNGNNNDFISWLTLNGGATANDECGDVTWSYHILDSTETCGSTRIVDVRFYATDDCGNADSTDASFIIADTTIPSITTQAQDTTVECDGNGNVTDFNNWLTNHGGASASDVCSEFSWEYTIMDSTANCGATQVVDVRFYATDDCGNVDSTDASFIIDDKTIPSITTQAQDTTVECDGNGNVTDFNNWLANHGGASASDVCSEFSWKYTTMDSTAGCGATQVVDVRFYATDDCGNVDSTDASFIIDDTTMPSITTQAQDTTVECNGNGNVTDFNNWLANHGGASASDICSEFSWKYTIMDSTASCGATQVVDVRFYATDDCGNVDSTDASFIIDDTTMPSITTQAQDTTVECDGNGNVTDFNNWLANHGGASASDICSEFSWKYTIMDSTAGCGATQVVDVRFYATDDCGNVDSTDATFTIEDTTPPEVTAASDETVECDGAGNTAQFTAWLNNNGGATAADDCGEVTWTNNNPGLSYLCGATGAVTVTFYATDECNNVDSTTATFTIEDTTPPEVTAATDETVECDGAGNTAQFTAWLDNNGGATAEDDCGDVTWSNNNPGLSDLCGATGAVTVTFYATDECYNVDSTIATFIIEDTTPPEVTAATDETVECDGGGNTAQFTAWLNNNGGATAADDCGEVTWTYNNPGLSDLCGATGAVTVTFYATDDCGNVDSTTATFTIEDTRAPVLTDLPSEHVILSCNDEIPAPANVLAIDDCDPGVQVVFNETSDITNVCGTITRTWEAIDECGNNSGTFTQTIDIVDRIKPGFAPPADTIIYADEFCEFDTASMDLSIITDLADNCDPNPFMKYTDRNCFGTDDPTTLNAGKNGLFFNFHISGLDKYSSSDIKSLELNFTTNKGKGRAEFWLVNPQGQAIILVGPYCEGGECDDVVPSNDENYIPVFYPASSGHLQWRNDIHIDVGTGDFTPWGGTNETNRALLEASSGRPITMVSNFEDFDGSMNGDWFIWSRKQSSENGDVKFNSVCLTPALDNCIYNDLVIRTWKATDACGNDSISQQIIQLIDGTGPVIDAPADTTIDCTTILEIPMVTATDNCSGSADVSYSEDTITGNDPDQYQILRTWSASDVCGNLSTHTQTIYVINCCTTQVSLGPDLDVCPGGSVAIIPSADDPEAEISWILPDGTALVAEQLQIDNALSSDEGSYIVHSTSLDGCIAKDTLQLVVNNLPDISISKDALEFTCDTTSIVLTASATGADSYSYEWNTGATTAAITVQAAGTYTVTVTDTETGCTDMQSITLGSNTSTVLASIEKSAMEFTCDTTSITLTASATGASTLAYAWSTGETTAAISVDAEGTYTVTVTDTETGCYDMQSITLERNTTSLMASIEQSAEEFTCDTTSITLTASATGADSYSFEWNTGVTTAAIEVTETGTYTVTVTDPETGCQVSESVTLISNTTTVLAEIDQSAEEFTCDTTSIVLIASATGADSYSYEWNTGATTAAITVQAAGTYTVTVTDTETGCTDMQSITLGSNTSTVLASIEKSAMEFTCDTTSITLNASATGASTLAYAWSTGETTAVISVDAEGTYTVTVTDNETGCYDMQSITLERNTTSLMASIEQSAEEFTCDTASITLTASATGADSYSFIWNTGVTTAAIEVTETGTYTVTVTDPETGCQVSESVTLVSNTTTVLAEIDQSAEEFTCDTTSIVLIASATGADSYSYEWNTGATTAAITVHAAGTYTVTVTDTETGCTDMQSITLGSNTSTVLASIEKSAMEFTCDTTSITLNASATGASTLAYAWSTGETTAVISVDAEGTYTVTVTDNETGCYDMQSITLERNTTSLMASIEQSAEEFTCDTASITLTASATGADSYSFEWNTGVTTAAIEVTETGTYTVTVTDPETGCQVSESVTLVSNTTTVLAEIDQSAKEFTCDTTSIVLTASATGADSYSYEWNTGATTAAITVQAAGTYTVTVTDTETGCYDMQSITLGSNTSTVLASIEKSAMEFTCDTTSITLTASATGASTLAYAWNTGETTAVISVDAEGTYTVTVTDTETGCTDIASVDVGSNLTPPGVVLTGEEHICDDIPVILDAGSSNVQGQASYKWFMDGSLMEEENGSTLMVSVAGEYSVEIRDGRNGCSASATMTVSSGQSSQSTRETTACDRYTWNGRTYTTGGTYTRTFTNASGCDSTATLVLTINRSSVNTMSVSACESYAWNGQTYTESGTYRKTYTGINGCDSVEVLILTINEGSEIVTRVSACESYEWRGNTYSESGTYTEAFTNPSGCASTTTLILTINESTEGMEEVTACDSYTWNGEDYTSSGTYTKVFTNAAGCDSTATLILTINESTESTTEVTACDSYTWNNVEYTSSGIYSEQFTNAAGCDSTATLFLTITESTESTEEVTACESYTWNGEDYTSSGIYTESFTNAAGCDSLATLILTINSSSESTVEETACDSFRWNENVYKESGTYTVSLTNAAGCDSTATLILTIEECTEPLRINAVADTLDLVWCADRGVVSGSTNFRSNDETHGRNVSISILNTEVDVVINTATGTVTYNNDDGFLGTLTIDYEICDLISCDTTTIYINVHNDHDCDGVHDGIDIDDDNDGIPDEVEGEKISEHDFDGDGIPNSLDIDSDNDGITDNEEWQEEGDYTPPSGVDQNENGWDDAYDSQMEGKFQGVAEYPDGDQDPDYLDEDADGDGRPDNLEGWDADGDFVADTIPPDNSDSDGDGLLDAYDNVDGWANPLNPTGSSSPLPDLPVIDTCTGEIDEVANGIRDWRDFKEIPCNPITPCETYIPNAFSPNNDNVNDHFTMEFCSDAEQKNEGVRVDIEIYNRWGNIVYKQADYGNEQEWGNDAWWDGSSNQGATIGGDKLPPGTYFYVLIWSDGRDSDTGTVFLSN